MVSFHTQNSRCKDLDPKIQIATSDGGWTQESGLTVVDIETPWFWCFHCSISLTTNDTMSRFSRFTSCTATLDQKTKRKQLQNICQHLEVHVHVIFATCDSASNFCNGKDFCLGRHQSSSWFPKKEWNRDRQKDWCNQKVSLSHASM